MSFVHKNEAKCNAIWWRFAAAYSLILKPNSNVSTSVAEKKYLTLCFALCHMLSFTIDVFYS